MANPKPAGSSDLERFLSSSDAINYLSQRLEERRRRHGRSGQSRLLLDVYRQLVPSRRRRIQKEGPFNTFVEHSSYDDRLKLVDYVAKLLKTYDYVNPANRLNEQYHHLNNSAEAIQILETRLTEISPKRRKRVLLSVYHELASPSEEGKQSGGRYRDFVECGVNDHLEFIGRVVDLLREYGREDQASQLKQRYFLSDSRIRKCRTK